jgi:hypothetical protein
MPQKLYKVFTHGDLDGAVSLLVFMWARSNDTIEFEELYNTDYLEKLNKYVEKTYNPPSTLILDMALREELTQFDSSNFTFIDHHKTSENFISKFKQSKIIHKEYTSNAKWMYKFMSKDLSHLSKEQKYLVALADDFDSYTLQLPHSYDLNIIFWTEYKNKFSKFISDFKNGFKGFNQYQQNIIKLEKEAAQKEANKLSKFEGIINVGGIQKKTLAVIGEHFSSLVIDLIMKTYNPELFFFVNTKSERVNLRQNTKENPIDLGAFAEKICEGGGHSYSAGGKITPLFMEISKNLKPIC